jgi:hypothetical protein
MITRFPSIPAVALRFLLHISLLFEHSGLFAAACTDSFGLISLCEFPRNMTNTIPIASDLLSGISLSFWIIFLGGPNAQ